MSMLKIILVANCNWTSNQHTKYCFHQVIYCNSTLLGKIPTPVSCCNILQFQKPCAILLKDKLMLINIMQRKTCLPMLFSYNNKISQLPTQYSYTFSKQTKNYKSTGTTLSLQASQYPNWCNFPSTIAYEDVTQFIWHCTVPKLHTGREVPQLTKHYFTFSTQLQSLSCTHS